MSAGDVVIGGVRISMAIAEEWVRAYTAAGHSAGPAPYAYPAYDLYDCEHNDPCRLSDADLLAPALLNVRPTVRGFYVLQRMRGQLEAALHNEDLRHPLSEVDDHDRIAAMVKPLYAALDDPDQDHFGVSGTTLSKVLHRKRPKSIVLHDRWVRSCYVHADGPVRTVRRRLWADYMTELTAAVGADLRNQSEEFTRLGRASSANPALTPVRLLEIVAWRSRRKSHPGERADSAAGSPPQRRRSGGHADQKSQAPHPSRLTLGVS